MTATISGDGTSTLINLTTSGNTILGDASTDTLNVGNGGLVKDASGNVGIGTSSPTGSWAGTKLAINTGDVNFQNTASPQTIIWGVTASYSYISGNASSNVLAFGTSNTERMRIDSSGNLLVGTISGSYNTISSGSGYAFNVIQTTTNNSVVRFDAAYSSGTINYIAFYAAGTYRGAIQFNGTSVLYTTSSDYRLKEDIASMTGALAKVAALKPVTYKWKSTGEADQGFIAHELAEVMPHAVTGEKDAVDADGNPKYQGIDTSFLVATLTAAIQELKALVDTQASTITSLQADVEALKAQP